MMMLKLDNTSFNDVTSCFGKQRIDGVFYVRELATNFYKYSL